MHKTFLILKCEFFRTVRRTGFIILTLALPVLVLIGIVVSQIVSGLAKPPAVSEIGYVAEAGNFTQNTSLGNINLTRYDSRNTATQAIIDKKITEYFVIPANFMSSGTVNLFTTTNDLEPPPSAVNAIKYFTDSNLLAGKATPEVINLIESPLNVVSVKITPTGEPASRQGGYTNLVVPGIFAFLLMMSLIFSSQYVLQSLGEEKENRVMEILLSSVSTGQLLTGKVLGVGAAGLLQVTVWIVSFPLLLSIASSSLGGFISSIKIPAEFWALAIVYFILSYFFFAMLSASIAAITATVQEAQGITGVYSLFAIAPFWLLSLILLYPDNPAWIVLSVFPLSAPIMVMIRLGITGIPAWQLALSLAIMALSITGGLLLASKLLRMYTLMYGKRPGLREIIRNLKKS